MLLSAINISQTAVSGTWSFNTAKLVSCFLRQILVKAASADTTFRLQLTDEKNNVVYYNDTLATGTLREEKEVPLKGIYTVEVLNSSADEAFTGFLMVEEG